MEFDAGAGGSSRRQRGCSFAPTPSAEDHLCAELRARGLLKGDEEEAAIWSSRQEEEEEGEQKSDSSTFLNGT